MEKIEGLELKIEVVYKKQMQMFFINHFIFLGSFKIKVGQVAYIYKKTFTKGGKEMNMQLICSVFIVICILALVSIVAKNKIVQLLMRGGIGSVLIVVMNCLLPQYIIGINFFTIGFSALLGLPGIMTLYILQMIV